VGSSMTRDAGLEREGLGDLQGLLDREGNSRRSARVDFEAEGPSSARAASPAGRIASHPANPRRSREESVVGHQEIVGMRRVPGG